MATAWACAAAGPRQNAHHPGYGRDAGKSHQREACDGQVRHSGSGRLYDGRGRGFLRKQGAAHVSRAADVDPLETDQLLLPQRERQRVTESRASVGRNGLTARLEELAVGADAAQELAYDRAIGGRRGIGPGAVGVRWAEVLCGPTDRLGPDQIRGAPAFGHRHHQRIAVRAESSRAATTPKPGPLLIGQNSIVSFTGPATSVHALS